MIYIQKREYRHNMTTDDKEETCYLTYMKTIFEAHNYRIVRHDYIKTDNHSMK